MMRRSLVISALLLLLLAGSIGTAAALRGQKGPAANPDPNHTHADFAVWVNGQKLDFSDKRFMSGSSTDENHEDAAHPYLHLHDGIGSVLHSHKPGMTLREFLSSIGVQGTRVIWCDTKYPADCNENVIFPDQPNASVRVYVYVNESPSPVPEVLDYVFRDLDRILITTDSRMDAMGEQRMRAQWTELTDDACLYSRTCPERGEPPAENCIADPTVPCIVPD